MGENGYAQVPVAVYGLVMLLAGIAYYILARTLVHEHGPESQIAVALGNDAKGRLSVLLYAIAIGMAFVNTRIAIATYVIVAIMWLVPDRRIAKVATHSGAS
jgi:uncharacterized membrane protein